MKANIKTTDDNSTLKLEIDFDQLLNDNFEEICKAIALRGKALRELVAIFDNNNEIAESVFQTLKSNRGIDKIILALCENLNISNYTAQYLINNVPMAGTSPMSWEILKEQLDNYNKQIESLQ